MAILAADESSLEEFLQSLSQLPSEEWQKRISTLKKLVFSIPDYSGSPNSSQPIWYRSSKHVRRLSLPLQQLLLDARSAVVKEAAELVGTLLMVKLQPHPEDPLVPFVGRLLVKDLLLALLQLSSQTVKVIRTYGTSLTLDLLPHCRVPASIILLCERLRTDKNRTVKEDCARYLRCVLETWPCDDGLQHCLEAYYSHAAQHTTSQESQEEIGHREEATSNQELGAKPLQKSRRDECLTMELVLQIGSELGRALSDSTQPVRQESTRGFQVLFRRFRPIWEEVMKTNSGVVRDGRLRKKLFEAAARSDGKYSGQDWKDGLSLGGEDGSVGGLSYGSRRSAVSQLSYCSYASRGMGRSNHVPCVIGTPPMNATRTGNGRARAGKALLASREANSLYSSNAYVTTSGQVLSTPSPIRQYRSASSASKQGSSDKNKQPFEFLMKTPMTTEWSPISQTYITSASKNNHMVATSTVLRKRLSRRISGVPKQGDESLFSDHSPRYIAAISMNDDSRKQLSSINETEDNNDGGKTSIIDTSIDTTSTTNENKSEITTVVLEVVQAHLSHLKELERAVSMEKELLMNFEKLSGISISHHNTLNCIMDTTCFTFVSEEQVCDYFEQLHEYVDNQRISCEMCLKRMEEISHGDHQSNADDLHLQSLIERDISQSPDVRL